MCRAGHASIMPAIYLMRLTFTIQAAESSFRALRDSRFSHALPRLPWVHPRTWVRALARSESRCKPAVSGLICRKPLPDAAEGAFGVSGPCLESSKEQETG